MRAYHEFVSWIKLADAEPNFKSVELSNLQGQYAGAEQHATTA